MKKVITSLLCLIFLSALSAAAQTAREKLDKIEQALKDDVPRMLCVDERFATGGQPTESAFGKLAANGYRSVLNLRTANEGVDIARQRESAKKAGMRYINIPFVASAPKPEVVEEFIKAVKDSGNHPMLIHCGSANRVGALWMIYRVIDQGWPEDKAMEEAAKIGLSSPALKGFAEDYIKSRKQGKSSGD